MSEATLNEPQVESKVADDEWAQAMEEQNTGAMAPSSEASGLSDTSEETNETDVSTTEGTGQSKSTGGEELTRSSAVFEQFSRNGVINDARNDIDMILDIPVQLTVELGRTKIAIKNLLQLAQGSVVELDGMAGEPMDVLVNGCLIAQGEVVVVNEKFGIRLTDIITPSERIRKLNR
ncbi:MAG: flagellar motor switch protein FliN [Nitrosomonas sp.]|nr:flagellar motor switch protein FliN [Nitrosomonas sp.]